MPSILSVNVPNFPVCYSKEEGKEKKGFSIDYESSKRIYSIALDFLRLNSTFASAFDYGSQGFKIVKDVKNLISPESESQETAGKTFNQLLSISQSIGMVALTLMNSRVANIAQTTLSSASSAHDVYKSAFHEQNAKKTLESLATCIGCLLSLSVQLFGGVELTVASMSMRVLLTLYSAVDDYLKNNGEIRLEAIAKIALACIQIKEMQPHVRELQRKYKILRKPDFSFLLQHIKMFGKQHNKDPLNSLQALLKKKLGFVKDHLGNTYDLGTHVGNRGGGLVKGGNLSFRERNIDGEIVTELEFKLNAPHREAIQPLIDKLASMPQDELGEFLHYAGENGVTIREVPYEYLAKDGKFYSQEGKLTIGNCYEIAVEGVGSITIGSDKVVTSLYDRVTVRVNGQKETNDFKNLLSFVGLENAVVASSSEEIERLKVATLFEAYHPKESTELSQKMEFYSLPIDALKTKITNLTPDMHKRFQTELITMKAIETLPGRLRYTVEKLGKQAQEMGAVSLIMGVRSDSGNDRILSMLGSGALSSQTRFDSGMIIKGAGSVEDHNTGGASAVFIRAVTEKACDEGIEISSIPFSRDVLIDFDVEKIFKIGNNYWQNIDTWGEQKGDIYLNRPDAITYIKEQNESYNKENEGMILDIIRPEWIKGMTVATENRKQNLISDIVSAVKSGALASPAITMKKGKVWINNIPIQKFVKVATHLSRKLFDQKAVAA